jgi:hypothetical protein
LESWLTPDGFRCGHARWFSPQSALTALVICHNVTLGQLRVSS